MFANLYKIFMKSLNKHFSDISVLLCCIGIGMLSIHMNMKPVNGLCMLYKTMLYGNCSMFRNLFDNDAVIR